MPSWRDKLLQPIRMNSGSRLLIAVDPDGLLLDEQIATMLSASEIDIVLYNDPVYFRFVFETHYRKVTELGEKRLLVRTTDAAVIPYDLLQRGRVVQLAVNDLFPRLAHSVLRELTTNDFDALYAVYDSFHGPSTTQATLSFLLRHVYKLPYDVIVTEADVYQWLLSLHARRDPLPTIVEQFFIEQLAANETLQRLPLREWVSSAETFYAHLQAEWQRYLRDILAQEEIIKDGKSEYDPPQPHPFSVPDVRRALNDLFLEGHLRPVRGVNLKQLPAWTHAGVTLDPVRDQRERLTKTLERLQQQLPHHTRYQDWLQTARLYGVMKHAYLTIREHVGEAITREVAQLERELDDHFAEWMINSYHGLSSLPHLPTPVLVHHIPHYLASQSFAKVALIVLDGMSVVQWAQIKQHLQAADMQLVEHGVFAWVPTLTSVSRQALFSGQIPLYFADSLWTTNKEKQLWTHFWQDRGISPQYVAYERNLGQQADGEPHTSLLSKPKIRVAGLVVGTIDRLMHGAIQGHAGMQAELALWLQNGYLERLLLDLWEAGFTTFLTSDHGNKACVGSGRISDGVLIDTQGQRVMIYDDHTLYEERAEAWSVIKWPNTGLPNDVYPLFAQRDEAFVREGERVVSHGGISLEEVIVPFVKVSRKR